MKPCRHLDYETKYTDCEIATAAPHFPDVRYWVRGDRWTNNGPGEKPNPKNVQFCKLRGRINQIFGCYNGEMVCYEPEAPETPASDLHDARRLMGLEGHS